MLRREPRGLIARLALACAVGSCAIAPFACGGVSSDDGDSASGAEPGDAGPEPVRPVFRLSGLPMPFGDIPWPDDAYLDDSGHISTRDIPTQAPLNFADGLVESMKDLDGFGIRPTVYFRFDGKLDLDSLPATPEASLMPDASVFLIDVDVGSSDAFDRIAVDVHYDAQTSELRLRPAQSRALDPGRRYAAVVTRDVRAADGRAIEPAQAFTRIRTAPPRELDAKQRRARVAYAPVLETLVNTGLARDRVAALAVFHVQSTRNDLSQARALVRAAAGTPAVVTQVIMAGPELDAILGQAASAGLDGGAPHEHLGSMVHGTFASQSFISARSGEHGKFRSDMGVLHARGSDDVYFTLWLPRGASAMASIPLVIVQHGLGRERSDALPLANALAGLGYATIAIDAPFHGLRASGDEHNRFTDEETPDGFGDRPGDFAGAADDASELLAFHPFYYRDAMRQGVVDLMGVVALLQQSDWSVNLASALPGVRFRTDRIGFVGFDLGAQMGVALASYEASIGALVLGFSGGSTLDDWVDSPAAKPLMDALLQRLGRDPDAAGVIDEHLLEAPDIDAWRTLADRGSALAYAHALQRVPSNLLLLIARDDEVVHNRGTEALAAALGADIAGSDPDFVLGLGARSLRPGATASANFPIDAGAVTRVLYALEPATHDALIREHDQKHYRAPLARPFTERAKPLDVDNPIEQTLAQVAFFFESYRACAAATPSSQCAASVQAPATKP